MMVLDYCQLLQRVKINTPRGINFIGDENNDSENIGQEGFCLMCGKELVLDQKKFCSLQCVGDRNTLRKIGAGANKTCPVCQQTLYFKNRDQTTCSRKCGTILAHKTRVLNKGVCGMLSGICLTRSGRYKSQVTINHIRVHLGIFDTAEEAHDAYLKAKKTGKQW